MSTELTLPRRIFVTNVPAQGHINPTLPVVAELVRRRIEVIYYGPEEFRAVIEPTGAAFRAYPPPVPTAAQVSAAVDRSVINFSAQLFTMSEHLTPFMVEEIEHERPDIVIHDASCLWGYLAALGTRTPAVSSFPTFALDNQSLGLTAGDYFYLLRGGFARLPQLIMSRFRLNKRYRAAGMPQGSVFPVRGGLNIAYTTRELQPPTSYVDDTFCFVGPSIDTKTRVVDFPFAQLTRRPLVYISFGTIHQLDEKRYQECFSAFADFPGQVILSVGRHCSLESLGTPPPNFIVRNSVPQLEILQQCDVFVTHVGMNSFQEALYYDVPMVLVPFQFEQLLNARVGATIGAGMIANEKPPYGKTVSMLKLRQLTDTILKEPSFKRAAQTVGHSLRSAGGFVQAADEICNFWSKQNRKRSTGGLQEAETSLPKRIKQ